jgi:hypothetical protein
MMDLKESPKVEKPKLQTTWGMEHKVFPITHRI